MPESATERTQPATAGGAISQSNYEDIEMPTELFKGRDIKRSDTPETLLSAFSNRPDITMLCDQCGIYVDVRNLPYHRSFHEALSTMRYQLPHRPTDVVTLLHRRNLLLHRIKTEATPEKPIRILDITKINEAYELLKSDLEDVYEEIKQISEKVDVDVHGVSLNCSPVCAQAVGMCSSENGRWKSYMEDTKVYQDYFGEDKNKCYLAIFDGYHGISSAERCACEMHHLLLNEMAKFDPSTKSTTARNFAESATARTDYELLRPETRDSLRVNIHQDSTELVQGILDMCYEKYDSMMKDKEKDDSEEKPKDKKRSKNPICEKVQKALKKTYYLMDILLSYGKDETSRVRWSGTSALNVIIQNTKLSSDKNKEGNKLEALEEEEGSRSGSEGMKKSARSDDFEPPFKALKKTYYLMDILLSYGKDETSRVRWSGTSALNVIIQNTKMSSDKNKEGNKLEALEEEEGSRSGSEGMKKSARSDDFEPPEELGLIHVANAGSTRAILVRDNKVYRISKDHTPRDPKEQNRVLKSGGNLSRSEKDSRVNGVLSVTRGLGNHGDKKLKDCIIVDPHVTSVPIDQYAQFLVLASKGVWEVFSDDDVAALMMRMLPSQQIPPPNLVSDSVRELFEENKKDSGRNSLMPEKQTPREGRVSFSDMGQDNNSSLPSRDGQYPSRNPDSTNRDEDKSSEKEVDRLVVEREAQNVATLADLRTEVGSRVSEGGLDDSSLKGGIHLGLEEDFVTQPEHSNFKERAPQTAEEKARELAKTMAETLVQATLMAKSKDNITVMVVLLPACTF